MVSEKLQLFYGGIMKFIRKIFFSLLLIHGVYLHAETVTVESLPGTVEEFVSLRDKLAVTPEGGAAVLITAMQIYSRNETLGLQCLTISLDNKSLQKGKTYKGFTPAQPAMFLIKQIDRQKHLPDAYVKGATWENAYAVNAPFEYEFTRQKNSGSDESGKVKVFITTPGVRARPITLTRNDKGLWKASEFSSVFVSVKQPKQETNDDL